MTRDDIIRTLRENEDELHDMGLVRLYLFGSVGRGEANCNDVDLAFETNGNPNFGLLSQAAAMVRIEELLGRPVDLVERDRLHPRIKDRIETEMVGIF